MTTSGQDAASHTEGGSPSDTKRTATSKTSHTRRSRGPSLGMLQSSWMYRKGTVQDTETLLLIPPCNKRLRSTLSCNGRKASHGVTPVAGVLPDMRLGGLIGRPFPFSFPSDRGARESLTLVLRQVDGRACSELRIVLFALCFLGSWTLSGRHYTFILYIQPCPLLTFRFSVVESSYANEPTPPISTV